MLALPCLSTLTGTECIQTLESLGFVRISRRGGGLVTLMRGRDAVIVPDSATLGPAVLRGILRSARIEMLDFVHAHEGGVARAAAPRRGTLALADAPVVP